LFQQIGIGCERAIPSGVNREERHDRYVGTHDSGSHHHLRSGCCRGAALAALKGGVFDDAAGYASQDSDANGTGARGCAIGSGLLGSQVN
jgi:hypothetical protein